ncbi:uncharacterized protein KY384_008328 [Bacidia gigantensis]|uniref:uncharacterized protein n=1 Tax=Bacidia gigantensis TaxID=2732470 RepID=UPI001D058F73|nr:uncharacterized protein KY384_008328 [Bacidia gigantensis]KAG8526899.1 hypothetical protein KY384_008328 [Bacidia gigantensis]
MKPSKKDPESIEITATSPQRKQPHTLVSREHIDEAIQSLQKSSCEPNVSNQVNTMKRWPSWGTANQDPASITSSAQDAKRFNPIDKQTSQGMKLHKVAGTYNVEDEWTSEQNAYQRKMTIDDTLQKENAIRRLAEEADQEQALEDEIDLDDETDDVEDDDDYRDINAASDDGNESDDEEGFAESDNESDNDFDYDFWTPGLTTAATSTDHLDHITAYTDRAPSDSSIDCGKIAEEIPFHGTAPRSRPRQTIRRKKDCNQQQGTFHNLEDFIVGTLDEDRPLQEAYLSSLEQRKRAKQKVIPQDIDPSFPTSDLEADDDGNESEDELIEENTTPEDDEGQGTTSPNRSEGERRHSRKMLPEKRNRTPIPSPKRLRSPPPQRLFGQTAHRLRSPPPSSKWLASPPSSRRPSPTMSTPPGPFAGFNVQHLAQRPNLTRTASLPRTANPFWDQHHLQKAPSVAPVTKLHPSNLSSRPHTDLHTRGPVDIVQGLEKKRQRRREKFWRLYCMKAHAGKEKERKCQPGKGAERMRELGIQVQDRFKGYGHNRANLMLSI